MTQKSLAYVVLAVAVGYLLISAIPQQVTMYATPQPLIREGEMTDSVSPDSGDGAKVAENGTETATTAEEDKSLSFEVTEDPPSRKRSFLESTRLPELAKWWTLDIFVALSIYWVARRRLS
ncbi:hypothetical protein ACFL0D_01960 [Thermoproteota archaeon]